MPFQRALGVNILLALLLITATAVSGPPDPPQEDVLRPPERRPAYGALLGGNYVFSSGTLVTTCDCEYESGSGFNFTAGGYFELPVMDEFTIIGQVAYEGLGASYTESVERIEYTDDGGFNLLTFDQRADVSLSYLNFEALLKWNIGGRALYILAGPSVGTLISGSMYEEEQIATPGYVFLETGSAQKVYVDNAPLEDIYTVTSFRLALRVGLGYEIPVSNTMLIVPEASYALPFTTIVDGFKSPVAAGSKNVTDWKHSSIQLGVRFMFWL